MRRAFWSLAALAALVIIGGAASAADMSMVTLKATLNGASEVPPKAVSGTGEATLMLDKDSKKLSWEITYSGLTGPAKAAHFHGPAAAGANAGVALPIPVSDSPIKGSATLTDAQMADLLAGKWYVNIHTAANGSGEIRGQVMPAQ